MPDLILNEAKSLNRMFELGQDVVVLPCPLCGKTEPQADCGLCCIETELEGEIK